MESETFIRPEKLWRTVGIRADQTIVHLGCGAGFYLIPAAHQVGKKGKVIGIDIRPDMLAEAESRAKRAGVAEIVHTMRANLENKQSNPVKAHTADWVLIANILHQAQPEKILNEAKRIAKQEGSIVVVEWDTVATPLGPPQEKRVEKNQVMALAQQVGLSIKREFSPSPYHYGLILSI